MAFRDFRQTGSRFRIGSDGIGLRIGSDWMGSDWYLRFWCRITILRKAVLIAFRFDYRHIHCLMKELYFKQVGILKNLN